MRFERTPEPAPGNRAPSEREAGPGTGVRFEREAGPGSGVRFGREPENGEWSEREAGPGAGLQFEREGGAGNGVPSEREAGTGSGVRFERAPEPEPGDRAPSERDAGPRTGVRFERDPQPGTGVRFGREPEAEVRFERAPEVGARLEREPGKGLRPEAGPGPEPAAGSGTGTGTGAGAAADAGAGVRLGREVGVGARRGRPDTPPVRRRPAPRRAPADPVKSLMHRHRRLCERAVDPLEIAAGLEAHGVTDRTATRFRHRDVFSLAEEMYARVARDEGAPPPPPPPVPTPPRAGWALRTFLPGLLCAAGVTGLRLTEGRVRPAVAAVGLLAVALGLRAALARGPLARPPRATRAALPGVHASTYWLLAYALLGDGLLDAAVAAGPDTLPDLTATGPWPLAAAPFLALVLSCAPAAWSAHLLSLRARRGLTRSRGLAEFTASVRPTLLTAFALYVGALAALLTATGAVLREPAHLAQALTLGPLLFLARLLVVHGATRAAALALTAAAATEALALASVFAARLPGLDALATPVETLSEVGGAGSVPALGCGAAALTLLIHATRALTRASAHAPAGRPC